MVPLFCLFTPAWLVRSPPDIYCRYFSVRRSQQDPICIVERADRLSVYRCSSPDFPSTPSPPVQSGALQVATESMYYVSVLFWGSVEIVFLGMCLVCHGQAKPSVSAYVQTFCSAFCLSSPQTGFLLPGRQIKILDSPESRACSLLTFRCWQLLNNTAAPAARR